MKKLMPVLLVLYAVCLSYAQPYDIDINVTLSFDSSYILLREDLSNKVLFKVPTDANFTPIYLQGEGTINFLRITREVAPCYIIIPDIKGCITEPLIDTVYQPNGSPPYSCAFNFKVIDTAHPHKKLNKRLFF